MENTGSQDRMLEGLAWGMLLVWWGLSLVPHFLPNGLDAAGTGIVLLGVNTARRFLHIPVRGFSVGLGILTLVWGVLDMGLSVLHLDYRPPVLAILLGLAGIVIVVRAVRATARSAASQSAASADPGAAHAPAP